MAANNKIEMISDATLNSLYELVQLDVDAVYAYVQALDNIDIQDVRDTIDGFREDHERHVFDLSNVIAGYGGQVPDVDRDTRGFLIEGFTAIRSATGTVGALQAMRINEGLTNRIYSEAVSWDVPAELKDLLAANYDDEKRHLTYIEDTLERLTGLAQPRSYAPSPTTHA